MCSDERHEVDNKEPTTMTGYVAICGGIADWNYQSKLWGSGGGPYGVNFPTSDWVYLSISTTSPGGACSRTKGGFQHIKFRLRRTNVALWEETRMEDATLSPIGMAKLPNGAPIWYSHVIARNNTRQTGAVQYGECVRPWSLPSIARNERATLIAINQTEPHDWGFLRVLYTVRLGTYVSVVLCILLSPH